MCRVNSPEILSWFLRPAALDVSPVFLISGVDLRDKTESIRLALAVENSMPDPVSVRTKPFFQHYPRMVICVREPRSNAPYTDGKEYMATALACFENDRPELFFIIDTDDVGSEGLTAPKEATNDKDGDNRLLAWANVFNFLIRDQSHIGLRPENMEILGCLARSSEVAGTTGDEGYGDCR